MDIAQIQLTKSADDDLELITSDHHLQFTLPQQSHLQEQLEFQVFRKFGKVCVQALWSILSWRMAARSCCCFVLPAVVFLSLLQLFSVSGFPCIFFIQKKKKKKSRVICRDWLHDFHHILPKHIQPHQYQADQ